MHIVLTKVTLIKELRTRRLPEMNAQFQKCQKSKAVYVGLCGQAV